MTQQTCEGSGVQGDGAVCEEAGEACRDHGALDRVNVGWLCLMHRYSLRAYSRHQGHQRPLQLPTVAPFRRPPYSTLWQALPQVPPARLQAGRCRRSQAEYACCPHRANYVLTRSSACSGRHAIHHRPHRRPSDLCTAAARRLSERSISSQRQARERPPWSFARELGRRSCTDANFEAWPENEGHAAWCEQGAREHLGRRASARGRSGGCC